MPLNLVKTLLLLISLFPLSAIAEGDGIILPKLQCGHYHAQGILKINNAGDFVIIIRDKSFSPLEYILLGGNMDEKLDHLKGTVKVEFYVPYPTTPKSPPMVFLQAFLKPDTQPQDQGSPQLIKRAACGDKSKFREDATSGK